MPDDPNKSDARRVAEIRDLLPTTLGSAEIRAAIAADVRARSVFVSRAANPVFLSAVKDLVNKVAAGEIDKATARVTLLEILRSIGYTPEGGFPDDVPGTVPPAVQGTLHDISSFRRLKLIIDTQVGLMNGRGMQLRGMEPDRMAAFPAWELVRVADREAPRNWGDTRTGSAPVHQGQKDVRSRWTIAGGRFVAGSRLIALKGDPVWGELGSSGNFDDALDVDYPPFAFNSGMSWLEIDRAEAERLDLRGPDGETLDEWLAADHPVIAGPDDAPPPPPVISVRGADPELVDAARVPAVRVGQNLTPPSNAAAAAASQSDRAAELRRRMEARLQAAIANRKAEYDSRPQ